MFFLDDPVSTGSLVTTASLVTSASDLTTASTCEFAFLRKLDAKLGRVERVDEVVDAMLARTGRLGDEHEARVLEAYRAQFGSGVAEIERPEELTRETLAEAVAATRRAFDTGADVVFQATFFDGGFVGFADFIVRQPDGRYLVQDTKLARSAKVTALLQLAAYVQQLRQLGARPADTVQLLLGNGMTSEHRVSDILPVYLKREQRLQRIIAERLDDPNDAAVEWRDPRYAICGRCETCEAEIQASRDVLLVGGLRVTQRTRLARTGITTIEELADSTSDVEGIGGTTLAGLRLQAKLQLEGPTSPEDHTPPPVRVFHAEALAALPEPDPGDIFFDFEGDPLYTEGDARSWGLDYLFGLVDVSETFTAFWAHSFAEERVALRTFLDFVAERRRTFPNLHIYHYASYERTHLSSIAARHGEGEDEVDQLLRDNVFVDLYPMVKKSVRVGSRSYSIKKLEPLYMGNELRTGDVTNAAASITEYADARELIANGDEAAGQHKLDEIADYNRYDCVSTLRLRDWLLERGRENGILPGTLHEAKDSVPEIEPSPLRYALLALAGDRLAAGRSVDQTAAAFAAAALDYHQREQKSFWWGHFARLIQDVETWADTRDVLVVDDDGARVERPWFREGKQRTDRRWVRLTGRWGPGSSVKPGEQAGPYVLYEHPGPFEATIGDPGSRPSRTVRVLEVDDRGALVEETLQAGAEPFDTLPIALTPAAPPPAGQQKPAIEEWAQAIVDAAPEWPKDPVIDILRRTPPRTLSGALAPVAGDRIGAVIASILDLDSSYLAVQGPPGTGKTYLGAHVITALVREHGWRIGVVAQSHAVVENLLGAVVKAGLPPALVAKVQKNGDTAEVPFTALDANGQLLFAAENDATGYVLGGTAWDFSNKARFPRHSLDLLVIDEAGQYSLAFTIAASVAARNLLLLGDPQQLPQVSQGLHPEPIDTSALGWVSDGHDVLPAELGYFLAESRRMHPAVTDPVSRLSYEGELHAHEVTSTRFLAGIEPGLHIEPVEHAGNAVSSIEEANRVVELVRSAMGRAWTDPTESRADDPLDQDDVIVVSPYNAQVALVRDALVAAGLDRVRVGTVDKFQGQEAAIAIVTLAASAPTEVPRGMGFLILKNRLNVAISRAKWAAYLVYSPALTDYLPATAQGITELSAFITLVEPQQQS